MNTIPSYIDKHPPLAILLHSPLANPYYELVDNTAPIWSEYWDRIHRGAEIEPISVVMEAGSMTQCCDCNKQSVHLY